MHDAQFDPAVTAILANDPACALGPKPGTADSAVIIDDAPGHWLIRTESESGALLVLAETAYPGWRVEVDGQTADVLTAYTTLKAVCVPPGAHEIVWTYAPTIYQVGGIVTLGALLLLLASLVITRRQRTAGA